MFRLKYVLIVLTLTILLVLPALTALEAHSVGVKAEISRPKVLVRQVEGPNKVPIKTYQEWIITYRILNIYDFPISNIKLKNKFGDYLNVTLISVSEGNYLQSSNKKGTRQKIKWHFDGLQPRHKAILKVKVSTGLKKGKQMFTHPGKYALFNKTKLAWVDNLGNKQAGSEPKYKVVAK